VDIETDLLKTGISLVHLVMDQVKVKVHIKSALKTKTNNKHEKQGPEESFYAYA
jgi:hypothetical protein